MDLLTARKLLISMTFVRGTFAAKIVNAAKLLPFFRTQRKRAFAGGMTFAAKIAEVADESDGAREEVSAGLGWRGIHQFEF
jgi:hypothetical protein